MSPAPRKLYLLDLPHTLLAQRWLDAGRPPEALVRRVLVEPETRAWLRNVMETEVVPAFAPEEATALAYWRTCLERFDDPFLDHRLADIARTTPPRSSAAGRGSSPGRARRPEARFPTLAAALPPFAEAA